jgi:hypothetical protein
MKDLLVLIAHFDKYPLITQKRADYELFKMVILLMSQKEHLSFLPLFSPRLQPLTQRGRGG